MNATAESTRTKYDGMIRCEVAHATNYVSGREAVYDLGRYRRVVGIPGMVRYLCEECARGHISPKWREKSRMVSQ